MPAERQQVEEAIHTAERILDSINETIRENENTERLAVISKDLFVGQGYVKPSELKGPPIYAQLLDIWI
jgi:hypothetical protein